MLFPENEFVKQTPLPETKAAKEQKDIMYQRKLAEKLAHKFDRG